MRDGCDSQLRLLWLGGLGALYRGRLGYRLAARWVAASQRAASLATAGTRAAAVPCRASGPADSRSARPARACRAGESGRGPMSGAIGSPAPSPDIQRAGESACAVADRRKLHISIRGGTQWDRSAKHSRSNSRRRPGGRCRDREAERRGLEKGTETEKWTVSVAAHHMASALEPVAGIVTAIVSGQSLGHFTEGYARRDERQARAGTRPLHPGGDDRASEEGCGSCRGGGP